MLQIASLLIDFFQIFSLAAFFVYFWNNNLFLLKNVAFKLFANFVQKYILPNEFLLETYCMCNKFDPNQIITVLGGFVLKFQWLCDLCLICCH